MTLFKLAILVPAGLSILTSCTSIKTGLATAKNATASTLANVRTQAFGSDDKLQLTKAQPGRFLPENTDAETIRKNPVIARKEQQQRLLARNERRSNRQQTFSAAAATPLADLPPLPEFVEQEEANIGGILPPLDSSTSATTIDVVGETPELPPLSLDKDAVAAENP